MSGKLSRGRFLSERSFTKVSVIESSLSTSSLVVFGLTFSPDELNFL